MKTLVLLALVGLAIGFSAPALAQEQKAVDPEVRQQIETVFTKFQEAYNNRDVAAIAALHTQDAVVIKSVATSWGGGTYSGRQALEKMFADDFALGSGKMVNEHVQMYAIGNDIYAIMDQSVGEWKGHVIMIYVRAHDQWNIPWKIRIVYVNE